MKRIIGINEEGESLPYDYETGGPSYKLETTKMMNEEGRGGKFIKKRLSCFL